MAMKQLARRLQPLSLYFILGLTFCVFLLDLIVAHVTHSLTLLLDAHIGLCNIIVLLGCIISTTHGSGRTGTERASTSNSSNEELKSLSSLPNQLQMCSATHPGPERHLRNTFGWARVDVLVVLIACVFLCSLCFSLVIEALQTLVHISHHDEMHAPIPVMAIGVVDLVLNLLAYVLIGGYTFHQGSFLNSEEVDGKEVINEELQEKKQAVTEKHEKRQGMLGLLRDCVGSVVVIICAVCVYQTESQVAKYIDPMFSIFSAVLVLILSFPFMKESFFILMQTIPDHIDIGSLCAQLVTAFPDIVNVHELHVWRLTFDKTYCTAHIIFLNPKEYSRITNDLSLFFLGKGITHVTIQPEFYKEPMKSDLVSSMDCLVQCNEDVCMERHCCASRSPSLESVHVDQGHNHKNKGSLKRKTSKCVNTLVSSEARAVSVVATHCVMELANSVTVRIDNMEVTSATINTDNKEETLTAVDTDKVENMSADLKTDRVKTSASIVTHNNISLTRQRSEGNLSINSRSIPEIVRRTSDV